MIPKFNEKNGYLPDGIHKATLEEIDKRFGSGSVQRKNLFMNISPLIKLLSRNSNKSSIKKFILAGDFVTNVMCPENIHCILFVKEIYFSNSPLPMDVFKYGEKPGIIISTVKDRDHYEYMIEILRHDKDQKLMGILEVKLWLKMIGSINILKRF